jgi:proton-translocating NADH-quinone oxidoreductase chain N
LLIGILFKFPSAPFHNWAPDVYQGAPTIVTAFFVLLPKIGIFSILSKLCFQLFQFSNNFLFIILYLCGFFSLVIGSFGAMYQFEIKRFIAYSTISHVGFILISLSTFSLEGFKSAIFYLVGYLLLNLNFFIILLSVQFTNHFKINFLYELVYLCYSNSLFGVSVALVFFSMAGIPPLVGFFTKFFILLSTIQENMYFISFVMIFFSVLGCAYYIRIVRLLYFDKFNSFHNFTFKVNNFNIFYVWVILILILTLVNIFFFAILDFFFLRVESSIFVTFSLLWLIGLEEVEVILLLLDKNLICMVQSNCGMLKERIMFILDIFNAQLLILFSLIKRRYASNLKKV